MSSRSKDRVRARFRTSSRLALAALALKFDRLTLDGNCIRRRTSNRLRMQGGRSSAQNLQRAPRCRRPADIEDGESAPVNWERARESSNFPRPRTNYRRSGCLATRQHRLDARVRLAKSPDYLVLLGINLHEGTGSNDGIKRVVIGLDIRGPACWSKNNGISPSPRNMRCSRFVCSNGILISNSGAGAMR